jgi:hypothetical protein
MTRSGQPVADLSALHAVMAAYNADKSAHRVGGMNPRYRRLVIPGALAGLLLIVVLTALLRG